MKRFIKNLAKKYNIGVTSYSALEGLMAYEQDVSQLLTLPTHDLVKLCQHLKGSKSQLKQDLFVLLQANFKHNGYFVEFGATNGLELSNSYLLEKEFGWSGILAEPAKVWHEELQKNRQCNIEFDCVWSESNCTLDFNEVSEAELSTVTEFNNNDWASKNRQTGVGYQVNTISLVDLLKKYNAPKVIDYLSIDTEGSEYRILSHFDFDAYQFRVITCEHNFTSSREKIYDLLTSKGYIRKFPGLSKWDDWYVKSI